MRAPVGLGVALVLTVSRVFLFPSAVAVAVDRSVAVVTSVPVADHEMEMKAREAFAAGRFEDALELFAKLYAETLHPVYLRNIGRCHQKLREPQKAIDSFHDYLAKAKKISVEERAEIEGYIHEMEALRAEQAAAVRPVPAPRTGAATVSGAADKPAGAPLSGSGAAPSGPPGTSGPPSPPSGPGPMSAPPPSPSALSLVAKDATLAGGGGPSPSSPPLYTRWWLWTGLGAIVIGGVVAAFLLSSGATHPPCPVGVMCG